MNRNANRNECIWPDCLKYANGCYCFGKRNAPGGTRTHGLTPQASDRTPAVPRISPGETTGYTPNVTPKRAQSRNRNRNGTVTGGAT
jgi:hypothetical protein